ncbi:MAG: patatin-like phospholipase family protein [Candidatus Izemoplasmatales bacterium]
MKKLGLCLSGGGARGAFQVGAFKALEELGILKLVSVYSGTSIGSVNASLISTKPVTEVERIWLSIEPDALSRSESLFKRIIKEKASFVDNGVYKIDELGAMIDLHLDFDLLRQKEVFITLSQGGFVDDGLFGLFKSSYQHYIKKETQAIYVPVKEHSNTEIKQMILASCSIPIVFPPVKLLDREYYDGGVYDNVPVKPLVDDGCDTVIVIHLHRLNFIDRSSFPGINIIEVKHRGTLGGYLNFEPERSQKLMNLGYQDTIEVLKKHSFPVY